jgi:hypothetical protein
MISIMLCPTAGSVAVCLDVHDRMQYDILIAPHELPFVDVTDAISPPDTFKELAAVSILGTATCCAIEKKGIVTGKPKPSTERVGGLFLWVSSFDVPDMVPSDIGRDGRDIKPLR